MNETNKSLLSRLRKELPNKKSVLYIDDEKQNLKCFKSSFRRELNCFTTDNLKDALLILKDNKIDIVFCDYLMNDKLGSEVLGVISNKYPNIKRGLVTAYRTEDIRKEVLEVGKTKEVIYKPYKRSDVLDFIFNNNLSVA